MPDIFTGLLHLTPFECRQIKSDRAAAKVKENADAHLPNCGSCASMFEDAEPLLGLDSLNPLERLRTD